MKRLRHPGRRALSAQPYFSPSLPVRLKRCSRAFINTGAHWQSGQFSEGLMSIDCTVTAHQLHSCRYPAFSRQRGLKERIQNHADQWNDCCTVHFYWRPCSTQCFSDAFRAIKENWRLPPTSLSLALNSTAPPSSLPCCPEIHQ